MGKIFKALEKSEITQIKAEEYSVTDDFHEQQEAQVTPEQDAFTGSSELTKSNEDVQSKGVNGEHKKSIDELNQRKIEDTVLAVNTLDSSLITALKPHSMAAEQFRILKNNILFPEKGVPPRSIMVTSASPGEGKSFVSTNLAVSIASSIDEYVLLMDCDLRLPSVHSRFGFKDYPTGLSEYLTNEIPLSEILLKTAIGKLTILPGGTPPANPSELVSSGQMRQLIGEMKSRYHDRYIIIDSPPPRLTSEAGALARQVDGIIIVIKNGYTKKADIQDLIDNYGREKILGVAHNFAPVKSGYGYKKGHHYYNG